MVKWEKVLNKTVGCCAVQKFVEGSLSGFNLQKVFAACTDSEVSGQVRNLVRSKGAKEARRIAKKALKRRNLV